MYHRLDWLILRKAVLPNGKRIIIVQSPVGIWCWQREKEGEDFEPFSAMILSQLNIPEEWFEEKHIW